MQGHRTLIGDTYLTSSSSSLLILLFLFYRSKIVLVAIQDEGSTFLESAAIDALTRVGAVDPVEPDYRGSFALVGHAEAALANRPPWITQKTANRSQGPSEISITIPLSIST